MNISYVLMGLVLTGCGANSPSPVTVDPALLPYMADFEINVGVNNSGVSAQFANTTALANPLGETVGECTVWSDGTKLIQIDPTYWATLDENGKKELMYHENGHCAMGMQHIFTTQNNGCPTSIMYPYTFGESTCFSGNVGYYFKELASHE